MRSGAVGSNGPTTTRAEGRSTCRAASDRGATPRSFPAGGFRPTSRRECGTLPNARWRSREAAARHDRGSMLVGNVPAVATVFVARAVIFSDAAFRDSPFTEAIAPRATPVGASASFWAAAPAFAPVHNSPQPFDLTSCFIVDKRAGRISSRHTSAYTVAATPWPAPGRAREQRGAEQERINPRAFEWR